MNMLSFFKNKLLFVRLKRACYLLFVSKCLSMSWRVQELNCRTYNILREHWDHPYNNARHGHSLGLG